MITVLLLAAAVVAPPSPAKVPSVHAYAGVMISPDASTVAAVESQDDASPVVMVRSTRDGAVVRRLDPCQGRCAYAGLAWSPDGARLAFVESAKAGGSASLMVVRVGAAASAASVVATLPGLLQAPRWSPDARLIAVLAVDRPTKQTGAVQAGAPRVGEIGSAFDAQRIAVVPPEGGALRMASPADTYVYEYDWTPDGRGFIATAAKGDGDDNWWVAKLEAFGLDGGERVIASPAVQMNFPRISPDGRTAAFIGGLMSDFGSVGGDIWTAPFAGGSARDLTPGYHGTFTSLAWRGPAIRGSALIGADMAAVAVDPGSGDVAVSHPAPMSFSAGDGPMSFSADGLAAAAAVQDYATAPAIVVQDASGVRRITHDNDALAASIEARSVEWTRDGRRVQGWLIGPPAPAAGETYPMIVVVHGGPAAAATPRFLRADAGEGRFVAQGYYVFEPNPRGSYGQGEAFVQANRRDFGGADLADILSGVDAAERIAPIDEKRLAIYGHSYGGFMTMWAVTHTDRFKAAVAGAGIADWVSYYGENGIDQWMIPYFGASAYDDPAIYDKLSPVRYVRQARTPTFIYVGERDIECPPDQSIQFWHGLKAAGVPTSLVIYEGEGHGLRKPATIPDVNARIAAWLTRYMGPPGPR